MKECSLCGNPVPNAQTTCPYCGSKQKKVKTKKETFVTVNLEKGMPLVKEALNKLETEICKQKKSGVKVIRCIHGWGSSGTGGRIREKLIPRLRSKKKSGHIRHFYNNNPGPESIDDFHFLCKLCPQHLDYFKKDKNNKGVTYIIL